MQILTITVLLLVFVLPGLNTRIIRIPLLIAGILQYFAIQCMRDITVVVISSRIKQKTHKYGIDVQRSVEHAKTLDKANVNLKWMDALKKEIGNVSIVFEALGLGVKSPPGQHMVISWVSAGSAYPGCRHQSFCQAVFLPKIYQNDHFLKQNWNIQGDRMKMKLKF